MGATLPGAQPPVSVPTCVPWLSQPRFTSSDSLQQQDFDIFHVGKHLGSSESLEQALTHSMVLFGMALLEELAGSPKNPKSPNLTKPFMNHPNQQKPSPSLSFQFLLLVFYFLNPTLFSLPHHLAGTSDGVTG